MVIDTCYCLRVTGVKANGNPHKANSGLVKADWSWNRGLCRAPFVRCQVHSGIVTPGA